MIKSPAKRAALGHPRSRAIKFQVAQTISLRNIHKWYGGLSSVNVALAQVHPIAVGSIHWLKSRPAMARPILECEWVIIRARRRFRVNPIDPGNVDELQRISRRRAMPVCWADAWSSSMKPTLDDRCPAPDPRVILALSREKDVAWVVGNVVRGLCDLRARCATVAWGAKGPSTRAGGDAREPTQNERHRSVNPRTGCFM